MYNVVVTQNQYPGSISTRRAPCDRLEYERDRVTPSKRVTEHVDQDTKREAEGDFDLALALPSWLQGSSKLHDERVHSALHAHLLAGALVIM